MKILAGVIVVAISIACLNLSVLAYSNPARDEAIELMKSKDYDQALKKLAAAVGLDATDPENYLLRGKCFLKLGNYELAIADLDKVVEYLPNKSQAFMLRAVAKSKLGQNAASVRDFEKAIRLNPKNASKHFDNAIVRKDFEAAVKSSLPEGIASSAKENDNKDKLEPEDYLFNDVDGN